jgi:hypothetical protein
MEILSLHKFWFWEIVNLGLENLYHKKMSMRRCREVAITPWGQNKILMLHIFSSNYSKIYKTASDLNCQHVSLEISGLPLIFSY